MTAATKVSEGALRQLTPQKLNLLLGEITSLLLLSKVHRHYQVRDIADVILPAVNLNQFQLYRDARKRPIGLVTWGRLSSEVMQRYISGNTVLSEDDLVSGDQLFFLDFIAPYGHIKQIVQHIKTNVFPNESAKALRFTEGKKSPARILKFYGVNYKKQVH